MIHSNPVLRCAHSPTDAARRIVENKTKVTKEQLIGFLDIARTKYVKAKIEPGMLVLYNCVLLKLTLA